jgi:uncharacterized protein YlxP (DUF503 family)
MNDNYFSIYNTGVFLSNYDFKELAKEIDLDTPLKSKEAILKEIIKNNKEREFNIEVKKLIEKRVNKYKKYLDLYPDSKILNTLIKRAKKFQKEEF